MSDVVISRRQHALVLAALFGIAAQILFFEQLAGLNVPIAVTLFLVFAWLLRPPATEIHRGDLWIPAAALVFAAFCAIRLEPVIVAFDLLATTALTLASVVVLSGVQVMSLPVLGLVSAGLRAVGHVAVRAAGLVASERSALASAVRRSGRAGGYLAGLALGIPFVLLFSSLFYAADAVYARSVEDALERWPDLFGEVPGRTVLAVIAAWSAAGAFALLFRNGAAQHATQRDGPLGAEPAAAMLWLIDGLFALFVAFQIAYLFGGRDTVVAAGISYSQYARQGFFQLTAVAALVAMLLFALEQLTRGRGRIYVAGALVLLACTGVVLASAVYRLDLYQQAFGWTDLRLYALAFLTFLAFAAVIFCWSIVAGGTKYALQPLTIAALAVSLGLNMLGPSAFVVRANVARFLDTAALPADAELRLDVGYLVCLGDAAIPALVAQLPVIPEPARTEILRRMHSLVDADPTVPWQSWNLDRERARVAIQSIRDEIERAGIEPGSPVSPRSGGPPGD